MTTISVIMPTFNRARFLVEALNSVLAQTRPVHEIIVWDDGSTDGTEKAVAEIPDPAIPIRYFRAENAGKSRALNCAMAEARGECIWICDDDDLCRPDAAERMVATMTETGAPVVGGRYLRFGTDPATGKMVTADPGYWPDLRAGSILRHLLEDIFLFQNATLVKRSAYDRVGPFREDLARSIDYDMIVRLAARFPIGFVDAVLFDQRKHGGARGPAAALHKAHRMDDVWLENDQKVFRDFRTMLPLSLYEAMFEAKNPLLAARAGRLQRGVVYARRELWDAALEDFEAATAITKAGPLTAIEHAICRRAMVGKHGCNGLFDPEVARRVVDLRQRGTLGRVISAGLARGLRWRVREALGLREPGGAIRILQLINRLAGLRGILSFETPAETHGLMERNILPAEAYAW